MFFGPNRRATKSLAFRMACWFAVVFAMSFASVLAIGYYVLRASLDSRLDQSMINEIGEYSALLESRGISVLTDVLNGEAMSEGTDRLFFRLLDMQGSVVGTTSMHAWPEFESTGSQIRVPAKNEPAFETLTTTATGPQTRVMTAPLNGDIIFQMGVSTEANDAIMNTFRWVFLGGIIVIVPFSAAGAWYMLRRALRRVEQVTYAATSIELGNLSQRVQVSGYEDEIADLATAFNRMIEHNERLIKNLKEVSDDIAHDLRGPITRIRGTAEVALDETDHTSAQGSVLGSIVEDCDALLTLINTMLEISETEAGLARLTTSEFNMAHLAHDVADLFAPAAEDKGIRLNVRSNGDALFRGDPHRLRRAVAQLIDNAVKYTEAGGEVSVETSESALEVRVTVTDTGVGIAEKHVPGIFSRFYRADESRSQPGNGLGLSLAEAIVKAHRGTISVTSMLGKGSTFTIALPKATA
ncbi:MAG: HAMP domain-containing histidine kinase [Candidatus Hydrogenedentes bacterium]|nr:HAMP domain-containing histidine kinase [Candidatus Hydrogenedentota bacterium]